MAEKVKENQFDKVGVNPFNAPIPGESLTTSPDMKKADIYISDSNSFSDIKIDEIKIGLEKSKGFIRRKLSQNLDLRRTPEIFFKVDNLFNS